MKVKELSAHCRQKIEPGFDTGLDQHHRMPVRSRDGLQQVRCAVGKDRQFVESIGGTTLDTQESAQEPPAHAKRQANQPGRQPAAGLAGNKKRNRFTRTRPEMSAVEKFLQVGDSLWREAVVGGGDDTDLMVAGKMAEIEEIDAHLAGEIWEIRCKHEDSRHDFVPFRTQSARSFLPSRYHRVAHTRAIASSRWANSASRWANSVSRWANSVSRREISCLRLRASSTAASRSLSARTPRRSASAFHQSRFCSVSHTACSTSDNRLP